MTREEALKVLEMFLHKQCDLERTKFAYDANTVWEAVNIANKALEQEPKPQWIPCSERFPKEKGEYLVAYNPCYWDDVKADVKVGIDSFRGKTSWAKRKYQRVIAWMPLPQYESEGER